MKLFFFLSLIILSTAPAHKHRHKKARLRPHKRKHSFLQLKAISSEGIKTNDVGAYFHARLKSKNLFFTYFREKDPNDNDYKSAENKFGEQRTHVLMSEPEKTIETDNLFYRRAVKNFIEDVSGAHRTGVMSLGKGIGDLLEHVTGSALNKDIILILNRYNQFMLDANQKAVYWGDNRVSEAKEMSNWNSYVYKLYSDISATNGRMPSTTSSEVQKKIALLAKAFPALTSLHEKLQAPAANGNPEEHGKAMQGRSHAQENIEKSIGYILDKLEASHELARGTVFADEGDWLTALQWSFMIFSDLQRAKELRLPVLDSLLDIQNQLDATTNFIRDVLSVDSKEENPEAAGSHSVGSQLTYLLKWPAGADDKIHTVRFRVVTGTKEYQQQEEVSLRLWKEEYTEEAILDKLSDVSFLTKTEKATYHLYHDSQPVSSILPERDFDTVFIAAPSPPAPAEAASAPEKLEGHSMTQPGQPAEASKFLEIKKRVLRSSFLQRGRHSSHTRRETYPEARPHRHGKYPIKRHHRSKRGHRQSFMQLRGRLPDSFIESDDSAAGAQVHQKPAAAAASVAEAPFEAHHPPAAAAHSQMDDTLSSVGGGNLYSDAATAASVAEAPFEAHHPPAAAAHSQMDAATAASVAEAPFEAHHPPAAAAHSQMDDTLSSVGGGNLYSDTNGNIKPASHSAVSEEEVDDGLPVYPEAEAGGALENDDFAFEAQGLEDEVERLRNNPRTERGSQGEASAAGSDTGEGRAESAEGKSQEMAEIEAHLGRVDILGSIPSVEELERIEAEKAEQDQLTPEELEEPGFQKIPLQGEAFEDKMEDAAHQKLPTIVTDLLLTDLRIRGHIDAVRMLGMAKKSIMKLMDKIEVEIAKTFKRTWTHPTESETDIEESPFRYMKYVTQKILFDRRVLDLPENEDEWTTDEMNIAKLQSEMKETYILLEQLRFAWKSVSVDYEDWSSGDRREVPVSGSEVQGFGLSNIDRYINRNTPASPSVEALGFYQNGGEWWELRQAWFGYPQLACILDSKFDFMDINIGVENEEENGSKDMNNAKDPLCGEAMWKYVKTREGNPVTIPIPGQGEVDNELIHPEEEAGAANVEPPEPVF